MKKLKVVVKILDTSRSNDYRACNFRYQYCTICHKLYAHNTKKYFTIMFFFSQNVKWPKIQSDIIGSEVRNMSHNIELLDIKLLQLNFVIVISLLFFNYYVFYRWRLYTVKSICLFKLLENKLFAITYFYRL